MNIQEIPLQTQATLLKTASAALIYHTAVMACSQMYFAGNNKVYYGKNRYVRTLGDKSSTARRKLVTPNGLYHTLANVLPKPQRTVPNLNQLTVRNHHPGTIQIVRRKDELWPKQECADLPLYFPSIGNNETVSYDSVDDLFERSNQQRASIIGGISALVEADVLRYGSNRDWARNTLKKDHGIDVELITGDLSDLLYDEDAALNHLVTHYSLAA